jgi:hypothetical protein
MVNTTNNGQVEFKTTMRCAGNTKTLNLYDTNFYFTENAFLGQDSNYNYGWFGVS